MKIDKYISLSGYTSRRKACDLISDQKVLVNGRIANFSTPVTEKDVVEIEGTRLSIQHYRPVYLAYHKPRGIVCTTEKVEGNLIDALNYPEKIYPVGRLDKNSEGLLLLTNNGPLIDKIANAANGHEKEYLVTLNLPVRKRFLEEIRAGVMLGDEQTKPCQAELVRGTRRIFRIVLTQGLNRQIRRMCTQAGYQVIRLQRMRVMNISLGSQAPGEHRELSAAELDTLLSLVG